MIKSKPAVFQTSDRCEFETEKDAERWQEVLDDYESYKRARDRFLCSITDRLRTKDGHLFKRMEDYYLIRDVHSRNRPWIQTVSGSGGRTTSGTLKTSPKLKRKPLPKGGSRRDPEGRSHDP